MVKIALLFYCLIVLWLDVDNQQYNNKTIQPLLGNYFCSTTYLNLNFLSYDWSDFFERRDAEAQRKDTY